MKRQVGELKETVAAICRAGGIPAADAEMIAEVLVTTDMRGIHSHGVVRLARYLDCIRAGGIKPAAEPVVLSESANSIMASADGGLGIPASMKVMRRLLDKAEKSAISIATLNHSDHYGAAGQYAVMAAERGFVGLSMSNTCPLVAPTGGRAAAIGNNPFAEHKGYGFATLVEAMTGALAMSGMMSAVHSWNMQPGRDADTGHCFIVINPAFFGGQDAFRERIDAMIDELKRCPTVDGVAEVLYPGELEWCREASAIADGVELPVASEKELARAVKMTGM